MNTSNDSSGTRDYIEIQAAWQPGTRTVAWQALWRQIIADISDKIREGSDGAGEPEQQAVESTTSVGRLNAK